jgi:hypothetical protein
MLFRERIVMERNCIELTLDETEMPDFPTSPPISASLSAEGEAIHVEASRSGSIAADIQFSFDVPVSQIVRVMARYKPDVPDDFEYSRWNQPECSELILFHKDPYGVVPEFRTLFSSTKSYWIKAARKFLIEKLGIEVSEECDA